MFKTLAYTELDANKTILLLSLAINVLLFSTMAIRDVEVFGYMAGTIFSFWVLLIVAASNSGHEKRARLFAQLPVPTKHIFGAGWFFVVSWLAIQTLAWIAYGALVHEDFTLALAAEIVTFSLGALVFILIIAIGIDLGSLKPAYVQWVYVFSMLLLLGTAIYFDMSFGIIGNDDGFHFYPIALLDNRGMEFGVSFSLVVLLMTTNYLVFRNADNYLD